MPIEFLDANGNICTALDLVTQVTASAALKRSDGAYGSADAFQSMTATLPPSLPHATIREIANDLYAECKAAVEARISDLLTTKIQTVQASELDSYFGTKEQRAAEREAEKAAQMSEPDKPTPPPTQPAGGRVLKFAPKAAERQPGDTWVATVTHYKLTADKLELWKGDSKYPEASLYPSSPAWPPETWLAHMVKDGSKQPFAKPISVTQVVAEKKNDKGFHYVNVTKLEVEKVAA